VLNCCSIPKWFQSFNAKLAPNHTQNTLTMC